MHKAALPAALLRAVLKGGRAPLSTLAGPMDGLCADDCQSCVAYCRFKARKGAKGDTKGKSSVEPYAYWQLDRKLLNRRASKQAAAKKGLQGVVRGAKAGTAKGRKAKRQRT